MFVLGYLRELDFLPSNRDGVLAVKPMLWKLPVDPWVRVNFDVGFFVHLQAANVGVVVWDSAGLLLGSACS